MSCLFDEAYGILLGSFNIHSNFDKFIIILFTFDTKKLGLYPNQGINSPCAVLNPSAFIFIVGDKSNAVTIHSIKQEMKDDIAKIIGVPAEIFTDTPFTLIKNSKYNNITLIHEATHIVQNKIQSSSLEIESYLNNINEIEAFINEMLVFKLIYNKNFGGYISFKEKQFHRQIPNSFSEMLKNIWEHLIGFSFWGITKEDKKNILNKLLQFS